MKEYWKKTDTNHTGESWFSHKHNGSWCNGRQTPVQPIQTTQPASDSVGLMFKLIIASLTRIEKVLDQMGFQEPVQKIQVGEPEIPVVEGIEESTKDDLPF